MTTLALVAPSPSHLLDHYGACTEAVAWSVEHPTLDALWAACPRAPWMIWTTGRLDDLGFHRSEAPLRAFAAACVRRVEALLPDVRSRAALQTADEVVAGRRPHADLDGAWKGARDAVREGARGSNWCASVAAATMSAAHLVRPRAADGAWEVSRQVLRAVAWHPDAEVTVEAEERWQIALLHDLLDGTMPRIFPGVWERYLMETTEGAPR